MHYVKDTYMYQDVSAILCPGIDFSINVLVCKDEHGTGSA